MVVIDNNLERQWQYEAIETSMAIPSSGVLVRIIIAEVKDADRLKHVFEAVPYPRLRSDGWTCVSWVQEALQKSIEDGSCLGRSLSEWDQIRSKALWYVTKKKAEHRFDGLADFDQCTIATYDALNAQEITA